MHARTPRRRLTAAVILAAGVLGLGAAGPAAAATPTASSVTPYGLAVSPTGDVYVADAANAVVKKINAAGTTETVVAGISGTPGLPTPGPATASKLSVPSGLAVDATGNLFIADAGETQAVLKVTTAGQLSVVAGIPGASGKALVPGPATATQLSGPSGLAVDGSGNLYISDVFNAVIAKVDPAGDLSIAAGVQGVYAAPKPFGPATSSHLYLATGVAADPAGNLFIADSGNHVVSKVDTFGNLSIAAGRVGEVGSPEPGPVDWTALSGPTGVALDGSGNLYIADAVNNLVVKVDPAGDLSIVAGNGEEGTPTPGPAKESKLNGPTDLAVDGAGNLFIADSVNNRVLKVDPSGTLSVFAGTGQGLDLREKPEDVVCADARVNSGPVRNVTVPTGKKCALIGTRVTGNVTANGAASVEIDGATIEGTLTVSNSKGVNVYDSKVGGDAVLEDNEGPVVFQNNTVDGRVILRRNGEAPDSVVVVGNEVEEGIACVANEGVVEEGCNMGGTEASTEDPDPEPEPNRAPVARDDTPDAVNEDAVLTVAAPGVLGNDTDADGDTLQAERVSGPSHGSLSLAADGSFTYTPEANYSGADSFTYRVSDGEATSEVATVRLTVRPLNDAPTITSVVGSSCAANGLGGTFAVTVADIDTPSPTVTAVSGSTAVLPASGVKVTGSGTSRTLALTGVKTGRTTVTVRVSDGQGQATLPITVASGDQRSDTLRGTDGLDLLLGQAGGDTLSGLGGADVLCGGAGTDVLVGGDGTDILAGQADGDLLYGDAGDDLLEGGDGVDLLFGGDGNDRLDGGAAADLLFGGDGNDRLTGGTGPDLFSGGPGTDVATDYTRKQLDILDGTTP